jgi:hypothetical protein
MGYADSLVSIVVKVVAENWGLVGTMGQGLARPGLAGHGAARIEARRGKDKSTTSTLLNGGTMSNKLFYGKMSTDPDLRKLREQYPENELRQGQVIPYREIERILGEKKGSARWNSVTNRWRRFVKRETLEQIETEPGVGFKVLTDQEKVEYAQKQREKSRKSVLRGVRTIVKVNPKRLGEQGLRMYNHECLQYAAIKGVNQLRASIPKPSMLDGKEASHGTV